MKTEKYERSFLLVILVLNIILRLSIPFLHTGIWWDEAVYLGLAENLAEKGQYSINLQPEKFQEFYSTKLVFDESFRPPLFPSMLAIFEPFGETIQMLVSPFLGIVSIILTYVVARKIFGNKIAILSAIFLSVSPMFFLFSERTLTESLFASVSVLVFYFSIKSLENNKSLFLFSLLVAISFLTRYVGLLLFLFFPISFFVKKRVVNPKILILSIFVFLLAISPWFAFSYLRYGDFLGALTTSFGEISKPFYKFDFSFYLVNFLNTFGLVSVFIIFFLFYLKNNKDSRILLTFLLVLLLFFSFLIERKEIRYIVSFSPIFVIAFSIGFLKFYEIFSKKKLAFMILIFILFFDAWSAYSILSNSFDSGEANKKAAQYLKSLDGDYIVAENYPVFNYVSKKFVLPFPQEESKLLEMINQYKIAHVVVDNFEPSTPDYARNLDSSFVIKEVRSRDHVVTIFKLPIQE